MYFMYRAIADGTNALVRPPATTRHAAGDFVVMLQSRTSIYSSIYSTVAPNADTIDTQSARAVVILWEGGNRGRALPVPLGGQSESHTTARRSAPLHPGYNSLCPILTSFQQELCHALVPYALSLLSTPFHFPRPAHPPTVGPTPNVHSGEQIPELPRQQQRPLQPVSWPSPLRIVAPLQISPRPRVWERCQNRRQATSSTAPRGFRWRTWRCCLGTC